MLIGCFKTVDHEFPGGVAFEPGCWDDARCTPEQQFEAPDGWVIDGYEVPIECPDLEPSKAFLLHPANATGQQPVAILFHSGAFDYVRVPQLPDPTAGEHLKEPPRLESEWAFNKVFATLGMGPDPGGRPELHAGALPIALAEAGISVLMPANCWGDLWHNAQGGNENDAQKDLFARNGYALAGWSWRLVAEAGFASSQGITLPFTANPNELYLAGQGEGGRAVSELVTAGHAPAAILLDSTADDLNAFYNGNQQIWGPTVQGLNRVFPGGAATTEAGALFKAAPLPPTVYLYSSLDSQIPKGAHDQILNKLGPHHPIDTEVSAHVLTGHDLELARQAVTFLTE